MTELKRLARERGMTLVDVANELDLSVPQVRFAATTRTAQFDKVKKYLLSVPKVDVQIINQIVMKHDIPVAEIARRIDELPSRLIKIRNGIYILHRNIEQKLKKML